MLHLAFAVTLWSCNPALSVVAHRGGLESGFPENTLPAFHNAARAGAQVLEVDVRATRDGALVVHHDARVNRTTNGRGRVRGLTLAELQRLDAGNGTRIPTLAQVLEQARVTGVEVLIDIKHGRNLDHAALVAQARAKRHLARSIFGVRSLEDHERLASQAPDLRFLAFVPRRGLVDEFLERGVEIVRLWPSWLDIEPDLVERIHRRGAKVWVTTGRASVDDLRELASRGVDGLVTDRPGEAAAELACPGTG